MSSIFSPYWVQEDHIQECFSEGFEGHPIDKV